MKNNNKIDSLQFFIIGMMIGNSLFVGMGNIILIQIAKQDSWIVALIATIVGLIPIILLNIIMNYNPSLNIIDKIQKLFKPFFAFILNLIIIIIISMILIISIWALSNFANTKYLTETPPLFIGILFSVPIIYACIKGIETIARTTQILFYFNIIIYTITVLSLAQYIEIQNIKPILVGGVEPIIKGVFNFIIYCFSPFITLLIIPKNDIVDNKKLGRYLVFGYIGSTLIMALVFFINISTIGLYISSLYRYPEYFVIKKLSITHAFDNVENFLAAHWIFNIFTTCIMCLYYLKHYFVQVFKIKKEQTKFITIIIIALICTYIATNIFKKTSTDNTFMTEIFPIYFGTTLLITIIIICSKIFIKKKNKTSNQTKKL